jgi:RNA polymerase sigma-70 factor (ECF subfamily)
MSAATMLMTSAPATIWRRGWRVAPAAGALNLPAATGMMDLPAAAGGRTGGQRLTTTAIGEADDEILAGLIAAGDQRAFGEIVRRHGGRLRALALGFAGGAADADDIVQETFLSFWRTAARWRPDGAPLGAYLTRIAVNRAIDGDRRRRVRRFFGLEAADAIADTEPAADVRLADRQSLMAVARDIRQLPARQRAAILLAADGDRSNGEIAGVMGLSEGAVEQLLVRARRTLRARLAEREG